MSDSEMLSKASYVERGGLVWGYGAHVSFPFARLHLDEGKIEIRVDVVSIYKQVHTIRNSEFRFFEPGFLPWRMTFHHAAKSVPEKIIFLTWHRSRLEAALRRFGYRSADP